MNKIEKLLKKISEKDRSELLNILQLLTLGDNKICFIEIKNTDFFRVKCGGYRIIFHKNGKEIIIDSIRLRDNNIYNNL